MIFKFIKFICYRLFKECHLIKTPASCNYSFTNSFFSFYLVIFVSYN